MSIAGRLLGISGTRAASTGRANPVGATQNIMWGAPGLPMTAQWDADAAINVGYYGYIYHYRCARKIAMTIAGLPLRVGPNPDSPGTYNTSAPLARLLGPPPGGPTPNITPRQLLTWSIVSYLITGRWGWETPTMPGTNIPTALWPLVASKLFPIPSDKPGEWFSGYRYQLVTGQKNLGPNDVFYAWRPSQSDWRQPESAMQAMALPTQMAVALDKFMVSFMRNSMVSPTMVVTPEFDDPDMRRAFQDQFLSEMTGVDNAGRTAFAEWDDDMGEGKTPSIQVVKLGTTPVDAQLIETHNAVRDIICDGWGMPLSILGQAAERTYENADQEHRNYWTGPVLETVYELQDLINIGLAPRFGDEVAWFDLSKVEALKPARRFTQMSGDTAVTSGIAVVEEVREDLELAAEKPASSAAEVDPVPAVDDTPGASGGSTGSSTRATAAPAKVDSATVLAYLADNYPQRVLGWVHDATWIRRQVPLSSIKMARRPGGRDWDKVEAIAKAINDGKQMDPVVLVDTGEDQLEVADGYHRTLAFDRAGKTTIDAYVGTGVGRHGPWEREMHDAKLNRSDDDPMVAQALAALDDLSARLADGGHPVATERLMAYWAEGEGAAKIRWGVPGDFDRCRMHLGKYVRPDEVNGLCANLHHRATGAWPGHAPTEQGRDAQLVTETGPEGAGALLPVAGKPMAKHRPTKSDTPGICGLCGQKISAAIHLRPRDGKRELRQALDHVRHGGTGHSPVPSGHHSALRRATGRKVDAQAKSLEPAAEEAMRGLFAQQRKATIDRLNGNRGKAMLRAAQPPSGDEPAPVVDAGQVYDYQHWVAKTREALNPMYAAVRALTEDRLAGKFPATPGSTPAIAAALQARSTALAQTVSRTTYDQIVQALTDAVARGDSIAQMTDAVNRIFDDADATRAQTIARTEVIGAMNTAADAHATALGPDIVAGKEWIATHDNRTRHTHATADGQLRPMGSPFLVGGYPLEHPGDPSAPPSEVINCRCTTGYLTPAEYARRTSIHMPTNAPPIAA